MPVSASEQAVVEEASRPVDGELIRDQSRAWDKALLEHSYADLEAILTETYVNDGVTRKEYIAGLELVTAIGIKWEVSSRDNITVLFHGDAALVSVDAAVEASDATTD